MGNYLVHQLRKLIAELSSRQDGQALVEYALILTLVAVVALAVLTSLGNDIVTELSSVVGSL